MAAPDALICRIAQPKDKPGLLHLWHRVFGDNPEYAARCLDIFAGLENVLVAETAPNGVIAMLLMVPCRAGPHRGIYLYALATEPAHRGQGVMRALMAESERLAVRDSAVFTVLIPASEGLYSYYQKHGYGHQLSLRHLALSWSLQAAETGLSWGALSPRLLAKLRKRWLDIPTIYFEGKRAVLIAQDLAEGGTLLAEGARGYAVYKPQNSTLLVAELAAQNNGAAQDMLHALMKQTKTNRARLTLPMASTLFAGQGVLRHTALLKSLSPAFCFQDSTYLRFAMDDAFVFNLPGGS